MESQELSTTHEKALRERESKSGNREESLHQAPILGIEEEEQRGEERGPIA
jgi:hypothetical protein